MVGATAATVALAARAALDTHRGTIEILHLMGATDFQVARLFQRRIALDALFGGLVGFILAGFVLIAIGERVSALGSELLGTAAIPGRGLAGPARFAGVRRYPRHDGRPAHHPARSGADAVIRFLFRTVLVVLILYGIGYAAFAMLLPQPAGDERTDAIVVLTGGSGRLERGFDLVERGVSRRMMISGVNRTVRPNELAEAYDVEPRLLDCCVVLERESFDTRSNADEVARWVVRRRIRSIRLVTNEVHMPRARYELRKRVGKDLRIVQDAVPSEPDFKDIYLEYNYYLLGRAADLIGI